MCEEGRDIAGLQVAPFPLRFLELSKRYGSCWMLAVVFHLGIYSYKKRR